MVVRSIVYIVIKMVKRGFRFRMVVYVGFNDIVEYDIFFDFDGGDKFD